VGCSVDEALTCLHLQAFCRRAGFSRQEAEDPLFAASAADLQQTGAEDRGIPHFSRMQAARSAATTAIRWKDAALPYQSGLLQRAFLDHLISGLSS
jgi:hypothetical protein